MLPNMIKPITITLGLGKVAIGRQVTKKLFPIAVVSFQETKSYHDIGSPLTSKEITSDGYEVIIQATSDASLRVLEDAVRGARILLAKRNMLNGIIRDNR